MPAEYDFERSGYGMWPKHGYFLIFLKEAASSYNSVSGRGNVEVRVK